MKSWYKSKTIWLNLATAALSVTVALSDTELVRQNPQIATAVAGVIAALNILLRLGGTTPIVGRKG